MHKTQRNHLSLRFFVNIDGLVEKALIYQALTAFLMVWRKKANFLVLRLFVKLTKIWFWLIFTKKVLIFRDFCDIIFVGLVYIIDNMAVSCP